MSDALTTVTLTLNDEELNILVSALDCHRMACLDFAASPSSLPSDVVNAEQDVAMLERILDELGVDGYGEDADAAACDGGDA